MRILSVLAAVAVLAFGGSAAAERWVGAWAASQQVPEPRNALPAEALTDATIRQIVRVTAGGPQVRIRVSNVFGTAPLTFSKVHVAKPHAAGSPAIDPTTDRAVAFNGRADVTVPAGAEYLSDPVGLPVRALESLAISFHLPQPPAGQTGHPGSRTTTFYVRGDHVAAADLPGAGKVVRWYQVSGVDVPAARGLAT